MPASESSLAEEIPRLSVGAEVHTASDSSLQGAQTVPGQVEGAEVSSGAQNTPPKAAHDNGYTAVAIGAGLQVELRTSLPRATAATASVTMDEQANALNATKASVVDRLVTQVDTDQSTAPAQGSRRSSRAAAVAANAGMARQAQEEERPLGILLPTGVGGVMGASESKKRASELFPVHESKRAKATASNRALKNTLEMESEEPRPLRKKRRQAPAFEAPIVEASPIITDLPPLPFTTSPELGLKGKKTKNKAKKPSLVVKEESDDSRHCEFCKKVANICVLMHCHACRRVYHPGCFVHAFKPFVDENVPILSQMERLQLEAPERRGNIFRCASCKAAFIDFYESGGYLWDCQCPTCSQPEKAIYYRQRKLVQMMNDMELEKQRKKENKGKKQVSVKSGGKAPVATPSRSNSVSRGRRTRGSAANENEPKDTVGMKTETTVEPMDVDEGEKPTSDGAEDRKLEAKQEKMDINDALEDQPMGEPEAQHATPQKEGQPPNVKYEPAEEPKLSGDELVKAVAVEREDENGHWCFPVTCSRTSSLRVSGVMKRGSCKWSAKKVATIHCECCDKKFSFSEFVHHTDSSLVQDPKCAQEDPMPFLFIEHRDNTLHTPLEDFLPDLRSWVGRQSANNTPTKLRKGRAAKQEGLAAVVASATPESVPETSMSRLRELALFKRPKHRTDKTSLAARLTDSASFEFLAEVVCLSPKYVMNMANGSLADRVVRSKTSEPDDSFPRKVGWLVFNCRGKAGSHITCVCCEKRFPFDDFVVHAGISLKEHQKRARQLIYVVEKLDKAALIPFLTFAQDLSSAATAKVLELYLSELHPPSPSGSSIVNTLIGSRSRGAHP